MSGFDPPAWYRNLGRILTPCFRLAGSPRVGPWPSTQHGATWIHAASLGELKGVLRLMEALPTRHPLFLTSSTNSGLELLRREAPRHPSSILPLDSPSVGAEFLETIAPSSAVFFESEAWPCLLAESAHREIPVAFVALRTGRTSMQRWMRFTERFPGWTDSVTTVWTDGSSAPEPLSAMGFPDVRPGRSLKWAGWSPSEPSPDSHRRAAISIHPRDLPEIARMMRQDPTRGWLLFPRRLWLRHPLRVLARLLGFGIATNASVLPGQAWIAPRFGLVREQLSTCPWVWVAEAHDTEEPFMLGAREAWTGSPRRKVEDKGISANHTRTEIVNWILDRKPGRNP